MARHTNEFEALLYDISVKKEFLELMNQHKSIKSLWRHLRNEGFKGQKFYWGYQVLSKMVRRLDLRGRGKGNRGRINLFLRDLDNNPQMKKDFIELVQSQKSKWVTSKYLREDKNFYNEKHFLSPQTIGNIMKWLGYKGRCGKPATKPESIAKEKPRWYNDEPGMN